VQLNARNLECDPVSGESAEDSALSELAESRYELVRKIGQGGAGVVYLVRDRETGERLAQKKLLRLDARSVSRLKREFRSVADLHHPNLIKLYDMGRSGDTWCITMEYLEGVDLTVHLRGSLRVSLSGERQRVEPWHTPALARVCAVFSQLAAGVHALHRAGMLHRDLKPSNVMVVDGRVVVLDFGLVHELAGEALSLTLDGNVNGTPAYMAPEQACGEALSEATDWYAFGVMLYEAISGKLPFDGTMRELLQHKLEHDPFPLEHLAPGTPPSLSELCMRLISREPTDRAGYDAVQAALAPLLDSADSASNTDLPAAFDQTHTRSLGTPLVGRSSELEQLWNAFADVQRGEFVVMHVKGVSGAGKSTLLTDFLAGLERRRRDAPEPRRESAAEQAPVILRSRCYEREAMPFKALDGFMDDLVRYLDSLDDAMAGHLLPSNLTELTRAFPVLERVRAVQRLIAPEKPRSEALQERTQAELALRELLRRIAAHKPLVLWVDDLQWGDLDSAGILRNWLESTEAMPVLLLLSYRSDEVGTNACLDLYTKRQPSRHVSERELELAPLSAAAVEELCMQRFGETAVGQSALIERIVSEAQGSPFLASQLVTLAQARMEHGDVDSAALSVEAVVSEASGLLPLGARSLLRVLAVAGRPMKRKLALRAAGIEEDGRALVHALRGLRLTRIRVVDGQRLIEVYHDRVREAVQAALSGQERVDMHRRLLALLEAESAVDPDWLHVVAVGAGERAAALRYGLLAAERATQSLAFERAAELYQQCIELSEPAAADSGELWLKLAQALGHCRRATRAADAYLEAAKRVPADRAAELFRIATAYLMRSARFEQCEELVVKVLAEMHCEVPDSDAGLKAAIAWEHVRLQVRGMDFTPRRLEDAPSQLVAQAYALSGLAADTQLYRPLRAALLQARSLRFALESGVREPIAAALSIAATTACVSGSHADGTRADALLGRAESIGRGIGGLTQARICSARAVCSLMLGRSSDTLTYSVQADRLYRANLHSDGQIAGEYQNRITVAAVRIGALLNHGQIATAIGELEREVSEARATDNHTALMQFTYVWTIADLARNRPDQARERLLIERNRLPVDSFGPLHVLHLAAAVRIACVSGNYAWAQRLLDQDWPRFQRSMVRRSAFMSGLAHAARLRFLLQRHVTEQRDGDVESLIASDLKALARLPKAMAAFAVTRARARVAYVKGDHPLAIERYREHIAACEESGHRDEVERGKYALGRVIGGSEGAELAERARAALGAMGVVDPLADVINTFPELMRRT
jgi:serine/threonine protein kinase/tetratricopeptide (TPR) repeat protein